MTRPADFCRELLRALDASEGRRKRRMRDTTADAIGMQLKRDLLEGAAVADPDPDAFEGWLLERCLAAGEAHGPVRAMAMLIWDEWQLAGEADGFRAWLASGAPSDDREVSVADERREDERAAQPDRGGARRAGRHMGRGRL